MRMVYVEDDLNAQEILGSLLGHYGVEVIPFLKVERFEELKVKNLDLILSDGNIFNKSALDVYAFKLENYKDVPIWLYSGNDDLIKTFKALEIPCYEKPRDMTKLLHDLKVYNSKINENNFYLNKYCLRVD